ncbi:hypothetical protein TREMEDRAFT_66420 [Tremella mesenterica DSM 1558]|uniref:uncharacterized protein n=1 Tax=Tremella mesenterica (strain ATCC 24925 / CBS 8224 / DSM 1558 / NBRC 9311 / NRRL Y-6157 / RJB 2259-6 / UBC 559-6) TaxID=578456 RepID=UPI00032CBAD7|nr:uncharacterized protein TREMEDRAFT_66420 [Tremella mesenterica DSM 1558]EIW65590.1 hypothetical protein TREMEDRAFT_66420 [Tremella mesenterica DSM 1558]
MGGELGGRGLRGVGDNGKRACTRAVEKEEEEEVCEVLGRLHQIKLPHRRGWMVWWIRGDLRREKWRLNKGPIEGDVLVKATGDLVEQTSNRQEVVEGEIVESKSSSGKVSMSTTNQ